jgi:hypothetical protein
MNQLTDIAIGAVGKVIESVGNAADSLFTSDDERNKAEIELRRIDGDIEKAYLADTDSARKMQIAALQQDDLFAKRFIYGFAVFWSLFAMVFFGFVTFGEVPEKNLRMADTILGFLIGTAISGNFNFFLGTTYRNQKKDDTIQALARENQK